MLQESILRLYRRLRLDGYRKLFGAVQRYPLYGWDLEKMEK